MLIRLTGNNTLGKINRTCFIVIVFVCVFFCNAAISVPGEPDRASKVRAGLLNHMTALVTWPEEVFENSESPFVIGFIGENISGIKDYFKNNVKQRTPGDRKIVVRDFTIDPAGDAGGLDEIIESHDLRKCRILFIDLPDRDAVKRIIRETENRHVLSIGTTHSFPENGGVVAFTLEEGRIRIRVNLENAEREELKISARVLQHAIIVDSP